MGFAFQERYQAGDSPLHLLDARVKVVATLLLILGIVLTPQFAWPAYPLIWALLAGLSIIGGIGIGRLARTATLALPFTLAAITLLFTTPGSPLVQVLGLTITDAGLGRFLAIVLKSWLAVQAALLLAMTTHFTDLLWALNSLRLPATLIAIISFMYRYLFTLREETERLLRARASRMAASPTGRAGGSLAWRARVAGGMVGNLFLRSYERSERVYAAMLARGYKGQLRTLNAPPLSRRAVLLGAVPVAILLLIELVALIWWR
ncbi:MAG: cobalt ECF transporter T component CbiQ [Anaerolineae bacterium]|nr:cobalt ECF transporter T component CbiQ [Anaerolineae bacterium]